MAKIVLLESGVKIAEYPLAGVPVTIGRLRNNTIVIDNAGVSRQHIRIEGDSEGRLFILEDLNSLNGTFVNNQRVAACLLEDGDEVSLGKHLLRFVAA